MAVALRLKRKRKERQDFDAFRSLITSPASMPFSLPANARIHIASDTVQPGTNTPAVDIGARTLYLAANLPVNEAHAIGYMERGVTLSRDAGAVGVLSVFLEDGFGRLFRIGEG